MAVMEGSLSKWTNVMKGWQYRWFVLDDNSGLLSYYTSKEKMMRGVRRGCVRLKGAVIGIDDEDDSTFTITVDHKTFHFQARDAEERHKWVQALEDTIIKHANRTRYDTYHVSPTIKDFDNKVAEADAYLQIMIEQTTNLEDRINTLTDPDEISKCQAILDHANVMLDNIKHSIVLLQIAKNTAHPVNGVYNQRMGTSSSISSIHNEVLPVESVIQQGIELGAECIENGRRTVRTLTTATALAVPEMSYSSSEGEDDFFDANDIPFSGGSQLPTPSSLRSFDSEGPTPMPKPNPPVVVNNPSVRKNSDSSTGNQENLDYDALYEDDDEPDVEMESHGSVIRHLLSQVKIGMDLTKVVLPTFILERRSLLEMYADYFAHPDLFTSIPDLKDPKDRMVQVVKWYLSSYHAGRKSSVAKKPYNPVLGEMFRCHWDVCEDVNEEPVTDGPVPWCKRNQLTFVAEQVSHHPPISAFYAECVDKRISFNAHVYTKSKFLGLSVCVYNIGQGIVSVLDYNEEYHLTFPNGYGRSILTTPWIELGGTVTISCPQTGYHCDIEFLTKPFYGNRKHRVTADIYGPDEKKPFVSISGEWNGLMEAKWADKVEPELFIDVNALNIIKKQVRPISLQDENESRKLWKEVTAGLRFNEIDKATNAKQALEQKQRDEAKERKESGKDWQTRLFKKFGEDQFYYVKPLKQRLTATNPT